MRFHLVLLMPWLIGWLIDWWIEDMSMSMGLNVPLTLASRMVDDSMLGGVFGVKLSAQR